MAHAEVEPGRALEDLLSRFLGPSSGFVSSTTPRCCHPLEPETAEFLLLPGMHLAMHAPRACTLPGWYPLVLRKSLCTAERVLSKRGETTTTIDNPRLLFLQGFYLYFGCNTNRDPMAILQRPSHPTTPAERGHSTPTLHPTGLFPSMI